MSEPTPTPADVERADVRVDLSGQLLPSHAVAAVEALDRRRIIIAPGPTPAAALTAAALLVLVARTHAHVELDGDAELPRNPWGAGSLSELLAQLAAVRPAPRLAATADTLTSIRVSTGTHPDADRYLAPATWSVAISDNLDTHLDHLRQLALEHTDPDAARTEPGQPAPAPPYGGMFAAAVVAADLFCESLADLGLNVSPRRPTFTWNLLDHTYRLASATLGRVGEAGALQWPSLVFAGCGSVGSTTAAVLACDDLTGLHATTIDNDDFDPTRNPYRYPASKPHTSGAKAQWVTNILTGSGAESTPHIGPVHEWTKTQEAPGFDGIVISSVDTVDGRYEVADILARTTLSGAVHALAFHVQREHLGDSYRCPFCDFVPLETPLAQAAADALLTGLEERRIIELNYAGTGLEQSDIDAIIAAGKLTPETAHGLLGGRVADLRRRLYAQAAIPAAVPGSAPPAPLSAPFVSWAIAVLLAAEVAKAARDLAPIDRRVEVDLHGYPADFTHRMPADNSGRCACARSVRRRWMRTLYPDLFDDRAAS